MASSKKRAKTLLPSPQQGQRLISSYFTAKSDSVIEEASQTSGNQTPGMETSSTSGNFRNSNCKRPRQNLVFESPERSSRRVASNSKPATKTKKPSAERQSLDKFPEPSQKIIENIFCQIPIKDLMLSCALVCRKWQRIIADPSVSCTCKLIC